MTNRLSKSEILMLAAKRKDWEFVRHNITDQIDVDSMIAFSCACKSGILSLVNIFLDKKYPVHFTNDDGVVVSPLMISVDYSQKEVLECLLRNQKIDLSIDYELEDHPIAKALSNGDSEILDILCEYSPSGYATIINGLSLLHLSARYAGIGLIRKILNQGVSPFLTVTNESHDYYGYTALDIAIDEGRAPNVISILYDVTSQRQLTGTNSNHSDLLENKFYDGLISTSTLFNNRSYFLNERNFSPLLQAIQSDIEQGCEMNKTNQQGLIRSILMVTCINKQQFMMRNHIFNKLLALSMNEENKNEIIEKWLNRCLELNAVMEVMNLQKMTSVSLLGNHLQNIIDINYDEEYETEAYQWLCDTAIRQASLNVLEDVCAAISSRDMPEMLMRICSEIECRTFSDLTEGTGKTSKKGRL